MSPSRLHIPSVPLVFVILIGCAPSIAFSQDGAIRQSLQREIAAQRAAVLHSRQVQTPKALPRSNNGFPLRAVLIGASVGCVLGAYAGSHLYENVEDRTPNAAKGCLGFAAFGTLIALQVTR